jgi:hypothetical protein
MAGGGVLPERLQHGTVRWILVELSDVIETDFADQQPNQQLIFGNVRTSKSPGGLWRT